MKNESEQEKLKTALSIIKEQFNTIHELENMVNESIAIIGMACRFPGGANSIDEFWQLLDKGFDASIEVPKSRWDANKYYDENPNLLENVYIRNGCFISSEIDEFDAFFFGITPREAESLDPQQRLLLEVTWEAVQYAALNINKVKNTQTGVFIGISSADYSTLINKYAKINNIEPYFSTGNTLSAAAGRLSYTFGFCGPCMAIDTACSSSLVALHQACQSLRLGESNLSIAGGVNVLLVPEISISFSQANMLSPSGHCKTFDNDADGYVRGEGCGIVILKRLSDAERDGDNILALIRGSSVNQDGASGGLTVPNGPAQELAIKNALAQANLKPDDIDYIEAHGTGTALGDPIEVNALYNIFGKNGDNNKRENNHPLTIGTVKTNIGHLEPASGIAGLIKLVLSLQHETIPQHINFKSLNEKIIDLDKIPAVLPLDPLSWLKKVGHIRRAGISSFGFTGTNAHVIIEEAPLSKFKSIVPQQKVHVLLISAKTENALNMQIKNYIKYLKITRFPIENICYTTQFCDSDFHYKVAVIGESLNDIIYNLENKVYANNDEVQAAIYPSNILLEKVQLPIYAFERREYWLNFADTNELSELLTKPLEVRLKGFIEENNLAVVSNTNIVSELCMRYVYNSLIKLNCLDIESPNRLLRFSDNSRGLIEQKYYRLLDRLIFLAKNHAIHSDSIPSADYIDDLCKKYAQFEIEIRLAQRCGENLAEVMKGEVNPLMLLFPEDDKFSAGKLYLNSLLTKSINNLIQQALSILINIYFAEKGSLRILEIGAGTGGTTSYVLPVVSEKTQYYCYTDISEFFFDDANKKFKQYTFINYQLLDIEKSVTEQGFSNGEFDIIIAANVLHATDDVLSSLKNTNKLLGKNGLLLLMESTDPSVWLDITFGMLDGWWRFVDSRTLDNNPILSIDKWKQVLSNSNFGDIYTISCPFDSKQSLIIAKSNNNIVSYTDETVATIESRKSINKINLSDNEVALVETAKKLKAQLISAQSTEYPAIVKELIKQQVAQITHVLPEMIEENISFVELGVDSLMATELFKQLRIIFKPYFELVFIDYAAQTGVQSLTDMVCEKIINYFQSSELDSFETLEDGKGDIVLPDFSLKRGK